MYGQKNNVKIMQKTFINASSTKIDEEVNQFVDEQFTKGNNVVATQSLYADGIHIRVCFYEKNN